MIPIFFSGGLPVIMDIAIVANNSMILRIIGVESIFLLHGFLLIFINHVLTTIGN